MTDAAPTLGAQHRSLARDVWQQFWRHKGALGGAAVFTLIALAVLFGSVVHGVDPQYIDYKAKNQGMSLAHPLGTDNLGRDMFARVLAGGRLSLAVGVAAMALSLTLGTCVGVLAGFFQRLDGPLMRLTDLFLALPVLPLLLVSIMLFRDPLRSVLGPEIGIFVLIVAVIGITSWMQTARIVRGEVLAVKQREFVLAPQRRHAIASDHHAAPPPQRAEPDHGFRHARHRTSDHYGKRLELPRSRLPVRFPDLGPAAVRRRALPRPHAGAGDLARLGHLADRVEHQLHGRRPARRHGPARATTLNLPYAELAV